MAFSGDTNLGATGSTANNQSTLDLTTVAAISAGDFVVVVVAADNIANGGDDNACSGVTLGVGGQALTKAVQIANAVAAQGGASSSIWYGVASSGLASGGTIRATFGSASLVDASGLTARKWSITSGSVVLDGTPGTLVNNTGADPGSLDVTSSGAEGLRVRGIASQVGNNTNLTPTASWTAWANGNSATTGTTGEMCARAESRIVTAANAASDPTYVSAIYASTYAVFKEAVSVVLDADTLAVDVDYPDTALQSVLSLDATPLAVTVATPNTVLSKGSKLIADTAAVTVAFNPAPFGRKMLATVLPVVVTGNNANLGRPVVMEVTKLDVVFSGKNVNFIKTTAVHHALTATKLPVLFEGKTVNFIRTFRTHTVMTATRTEIIVSGGNTILHPRIRAVLNLGIPAPIRTF